MKARTIVSDIYEVGIRDWTLHDFHGFATPRGVTYNSFLIMDEKICLIDGVKAPFAEEQLCNIRTIVDPEKIDYIVVNHVEPDHSGSLPALAKACPNATFLITVQGGQRTEGTLRGYLQDPDREEGGYGEPGETDPGLPAHSHAPLAGFHGHLLSGRTDPVLQ